MRKSTIHVEDLAREVMKEMQAYADLATDEMKVAVKNAADTVKKVASEKAPKKTGKYSKSFATTKRKEKSYSVEYAVWSPTDYRRVHLLEFGHAKRGGGRTRAFPHMAPAEQAGKEQLEKDITAILEKGGS